jgi:hypothetical protein
MPATQTVIQPSPETVWAILQEVGRKQEENALQMKELRESPKETDRIVKENALQMKEFRESQKETDRIVKENARLIGKLGGRFGEMIEYMVVPNLIHKFSELGFVFEKAHQHTAIKDYKNNIITEIDITLENGDKVMIVEVKSKPTTEDITEHFERMGKVRAHADLQNDKRIFLGAIAGMVFDDNEKTFALGKGFYVIEPSGDTFTIISPESRAREW